MPGPLLYYSLSFDCIQEHQKTQELCSAITTDIYCRKSESLFFSIINCFVGLFPAALMLHMNMHASITPYACGRCDKKFAYQTTVSMKQK